MEKIIKNLEEAQKIIHVADHLIYTTYPLVKDKRLLLKIILEIKKALVKCINAVLQYEYIYKRIKLSSDSQTNFNTLAIATKCPSTEANPPCNLLRAPLIVLRLPASGWVSSAIF